MLSIIIQYYTVIDLGLHEVSADLEVELIFWFLVSLLTKLESSFLLF